MVEPVATDRLFLGLFPDQSALARIEQAARRLPRDLCPSAASRASRYHVTVHHLGDYPGLASGLVDAALAATARIQAAAFDIVLDRVASFRGRRKHPLVLRCPDESPGVLGLWNASH
ncbi:MAG TPA: 2'-5' RNA ligase family protein, partial [Xanthomonadaceae bacterium]|nr:2'-5' RNA ligase family protein [Xanthomonadaceae bacterium]